MKPTVHRILKIRLETVKGICKLGSPFIIGRNCEHNPASYNCKLPDVINNLNGVHRWVRPTIHELVKLVQKLHYMRVLLQNLHGNAKIIEEFTIKI